MIEKHPHPKMLSMIFQAHDAIPEFDRTTHPEERGSGVRKHAYTVSPGLSARPEMSPTSVFGPAEPRPTARSDPLLADGKEPAGLDSTVALMSPFSVASPELPLRCRSSGISVSDEFSDESLGERSMSLDEDDWRTGSASKFIGMAHLANGSCTPPSPVIPTQVNLMMDALKPVLAGHASPPSLEEAPLIHPSLTPGHLKYSPLQYSPASVRGHSPAERVPTPECDNSVGELTKAIDDTNTKLCVEVGPPLHIYRLQETAVHSTPPRHQ
jgi:hypothetical protein